MDILTTLLSLQNEVPIVTIYHRIELKYSYNEVKLMIRLGKLFLEEYQNFFFLKMIYVLIENMYFLISTCKIR